MLFSEKTRIKQIENFIDNISFFNFENFEEKIEFYVKKKELKNKIIIDFVKNSNFKYLDLKYKEKNIEKAILKDIQNNIEKRAENIKNRNESLIKG